MRVKLFPIVIGCLLLALSACKDDIPEAQRWQVTATRQIVDDHQTFARLAQKQREQAESFCASPGAHGLKKMQMRWQDSMDAWQRLQWVRFGPITRDNDDWKLQFWPDKKNVLQRKVQEILNGADPITAESLSRASVMVQGLSAQELLLFDPAFAELERFKGRQCDLLLANTRLTARVVKRLAEQWQDKDWLQEWFHPAPRPGVTAAQIRNGELLDAMLTQVEKIKLDKLGEPLGLKTRDKKPNGYFAESWRSQHSLANIRHNLQALQQLASPAEGYGLFLLLKDKQQDAVAEELIIRLDNVELALQQIQLPLREAVADASQQAALQASHRSVGELASFIKQKLAPALGLTLGFNSSDGD